MNRKETPKKKRRKVSEKTMPEKIDKHIEMKKAFLAKSYEYDLKEYDINTDEGMEECIFDGKQRALCLKKVICFEQEERSCVDFEDLEHGATHNDLIDIMHTVPERLIITCTGLEPLNGKLTEFINNPALHCHPRTITNADYCTPDAEQVGQMIEDIRSRENCPLINVLAPKDNQTVYDEFVRKVLADVSDQMKPKRFYSMLKAVEGDARERAGTSTELEQAELGFQEEEEVESQTSIHEKLIRAKQSGEIQDEADDAIADGEDLEDEEQEESDAETEKCLTPHKEEVEGADGIASTSNGTLAKSTHRSELNEPMGSARLRTNSALSLTTSGTDEPDLIDLTMDLDGQNDAEDDDRLSLVSDQLSDSSCLDIIEEDPKKKEEEEEEKIMEVEKEEAHEDNGQHKMESDLAKEQQEKEAQKLDEDASTVSTDSMDSAILDAQRQEKKRKQTSEDENRGQMENDGEDEEWKGKPKMKEKKMKNGEGDEIVIDDEKEEEDDDDESDVIVLSDG